MMAHLTRPKSEICEKNTDDEPEEAIDPEDGISDEVEAKLKEKKWTRKITEWTKLWLILFPGDKAEDIPSPGKPFILL